MVHLLAKRMDKGLQRMKLAEKRKKEKCTSRVSQCKEHSDAVCVVMKAWQNGEVAHAVGEEHSKVAHAGVRI